MLVILESTTYPGTTDELLLPMFETRRTAKSARTSSCASRRSASIRATRSSRPGIFPRSSAASRRRARRSGALFYCAGARKSGAGQLDARRRDGEAAREHVPHDQHRPGERDRADVRSHGHQRVGSDRRRGHQAVRLHAVLSRAPAWAATAFRSTRSISRGRPSRRASRRVSSSWPATSTARCRISSSTRSRTR